MFQLQHVLNKLRSVRKRTNLARFIYGASWLLGSNVLMGVLATAKALLLARILGVEQYGLFGVASAYVNAFSQIFDPRSNETIIRYGAEFIQNGKRDRMSGLLKICLSAEALVRGLGIVGILLSATWVSTWFREAAGCSDLMKWYSLTLLPIIPYNCCSALLRLTNRYALHGKVEVAAAATELIAVLLLWERLTDLRFLVIVLVCTAMFRGLIMVAAALYADPTLFMGLISSTKRKVDLPRRELVRFLCFSNFIGGLKGLQANGDTLVIACFLGTVQVGYYRLAKQMVNVFNLPAGAIYLAAFPELARVWQQQGLAKLRQYVRYLAWATCAVMALGLIPIWLWGESLIGWMAGDEYVDAWPSAMIMLGGAIILIASQYTHAGLVAVGCIKNASNAFLISVTSYVLVLILATTTMGVEGAAWAYVIFAVVRLLLLSHYLASSTLPPALSQPQAKPVSQSFGVHSA